ncbi:MAG: hypothetical protein AAGU75_18820 [Bacillota bacterium]
MSKMYNYLVKLKLANDKRRDDFDLRTIKPEIQKAVDTYHSLDTVRNKKIFRFLLIQKH